jgi:signal transduction histidine kinase/DNA-binding response OmpR family regulator
MMGRLDRLMVGAVARLPFRVQTKLLLAFLAIVALLIIVGAAGLQVLTGVNERTVELIRSERKIAAYRQVQHDTTSQLYRVTSALLANDDRSLDSALRQLNQFGYDLERLQFVAKDEGELLGRVKQDYDRFVAVVNKVVELIRHGNVAEAREVQLKETQPLANSLERLTNQLVNKAEADMVAGIDASESAYRTAKLDVILFAIGSIVFALLLGRTISWSLIGPINEIDARLSRIAEGDFTQRVAVPNHDELGALAANVNRTCEQLGALYQQLEAASQHKSAFLANMSHELRTPLNAVIGYSEMLQEMAEDEGFDQFVPDLAKIRDAGRHLLNLINDILDLSKIEAGKMDLYLEEVDLKALVEEVRSIVAPLATSSGNRFEIVYPDDLGTFYTDRTKLKQSLLNLLGNASKFTQRGRVALELRAGAEELSFIVSDTGIGMTEEQLGRLFQAFSQADASTTRRYGGTGLGLAITKHFCEMLGGRIAVESEPGRGSIFTITLPTRAAPKALAAPELVAAMPPATAGDHRALVMVVDDDPPSRELLTAIVRREGYRVIEAADGEAALSLAREHRPDIITLDVLMPRLDGWAVLAALKSDVGLREIPVIIVTVLADRGIALSLGAAEFVTKPVDRARLAAVIRENVQGGGTVLVVDDDPESRDLVRRHLDRLGWTIAEAVDGSDALEWLARNTPPAMILLDLMMPGMDGFAFLEEMGNRPEWHGIPIVILTSKQLGAAERELLAGRTRDIIEKGADDLASVLRQAVARLTRSKSALAAG